MEFEVRGGSFGYPGENEILKNISFTAGPGSAVTILGPNGAGKTTLLRCMLGFLPWSSGQTLLDGKDLQQIPSSELWKKVAYVPQAKVLAFPGTCFDMVLLGRSAYLPLFGVPGKRDREAAMRAMERAGITRLADRSAAENCSWSSSPAPWRRSPGCSSWMSLRPASISGTSSSS